MVIVIGNAFMKSLIGMMVIVSVAPCALTQWYSLIRLVMENAIRFAIRKPVILIKMIAFVDIHVFLE